MTDLSENIFCQGLYLVAMPIGNRYDVTLRALSILKQVNCLACEDTRNTQKFLAFHQIKSPSCVSYHDHNATQRRPVLLERLKAGQSIALVSDGGMPLISDPGYKLVQLCFVENIPVTVLPGPSAPLAALCVSGLPPDRFFFQGFLPRKSSQQKSVLEPLATLPVTLIFFEAPHRLLQTLHSLKTALGDRQGAVARELTKTYENVQRGPLSSLIGYYEMNPAKGEIVILVEGQNAPQEQPEKELDLCLTQALERFPSLRDAVDSIALTTALSRRELYAKALLLQKKGEVL